MHAVATTVLKRACLILLAWVASSLAAGLVAGPMFVFVAMGALALSLPHILATAAVSEFLAVRAWWFFVIAALFSVAPMFLGTWAMGLYGPMANPTVPNQYLVGLLTMGGAILGGVVYWSIAGRGAGAWFHDLPVRLDDLEYLAKVQERRRWIEAFIVIGVLASTMAVVRDAFVWPELWERRGFAGIAIMRSLIALNSLPMALLIHVLVFFVCLRLHMSKLRDHLIAGALLFASLNLLMAWSQLASGKWASVPWVGMLTGPAGLLALMPVAAGWWMIYGRRPASSGAHITAS